MSGVQAQGTGPVLLVVLLLLVVASAIAVSWSVYRSRQLISQVQQLQSQQDRLQTEWGKLLLEKSTWGSYARVEQLAHEKLDMQQPDAAHTVVVNP